MSELILSDIWLFLCNFLHENDKKNKFENQLPKKYRRTGFQFSNRKLDFLFSINIPSHDYNYFRIAFLQRWMPLI